MLDVATGGNICIADLVIDVKTGELISPARAAQQESGALVWDDTASEWVTPAALRGRERDRTREARDARRESGQEVYDHIAGEWVTPQRLRQRERERQEQRHMLFAAGIRPQDLPNLSKLRGGIIRESGVAEPTTPAEPDATAETGTLDYIRDLVGPEKREEESKGRKALVMLAYMTAILAAIFFTRTRSAK